MLSGVAERRPEVRVVALYVAVVAVLLIAGNVAIALLPMTPNEHSWRDFPVVGMLARWDTAWYVHIADAGYYYDGPGRQSAVGFFPGYPALMRIVAVVVRDAVLAGIVVSLAAGLATFVLVWRWASTVFDRDRRVAWATVVTLAVFPFSFYLFGVAYAESLFAAACVGAFLLLERDRPLLAGIVGALALATRPVGVALVVGLVIRAAERRGWRPRLKDAGVLVAGAGLVVFCAYLWWRFDDPFAYTRVKSAVGWNQDITRRTLLKSDFFLRWEDWGATRPNVILTLHGIASITAVALLPQVVRRLGWGYAAFSAIVIGIPLATSAEFLAMGRYLLPAFPIFAVAAEFLARRPAPLRIALATVNAGLLVWLTTLFARWFLIA